MQCGAKCFIVEFEVDGNKLSESVTARTAAKVRKRIRKIHGKDTVILTVKEERRTSK